MVPDWNDPFTLLSPYGTIDLNDPAGADGYFLLNKDECAVGPVVRAELNDVPQGDGSIQHDRFVTGVQMTLAILLMDSADQAACGNNRTTMHDLLMLHLRGLLNAGDNQGRVLWTPAGANTRMLDDIRLLEYPQFTVEDNVVSQVTFTVDTAFPYAIDLTEVNDPVADGGSLAIVNPGTADTWPVFIVQGQSCAFTISHAEYALDFIFDAGLPGGLCIGGGNIAEINTFRNTIYRGIGGVPGDDDNLKASMDVEFSDFFPLGVGTNTVSISGASMIVKWNPAWA